MRIQNKPSIDTVSELQQYMIERFREFDSIPVQEDSLLRAFAHLVDTVQTISYMLGIEDEDYYTKDDEQ